MTSVVLSLVTCPLCIVVVCRQSTKSSLEGDIYYPLCLNYLLTDGQKLFSGLGGG